MKIVKRTLIGILAVAILVSGMLMSISAEHKLESYGDILKYYDPATSQLYANEDFGGDDYDGLVVLDELAEEHTSVCVTGDEKSLKVTLGHILNTQAMTGAKYAVDVAEGRSDLVIRFSFSASHTELYGAECTSCLASYSLAKGEAAPESCPICSEPMRFVSSRPPVFNLYINEGLATNSVGASLIRFDFRHGKAFYCNGPEYVEIEGLTLTEDTLYTVDVAYLSNTYSATVKAVVDNAAVTYTVTDAIAPYLSVQGLALGFGFADDNRGASFSVDDVFVQAGAEDLVTGVDLAALTDDAMTKINDVLAGSTSTMEDKNAAIAVFDKLMVDYRDILEVKETTADTISSINANILLVYSDVLDECVNAIDPSSAYQKRLDNITSCEKVASRVEALLLAGYENSDATTDLAAYKAEIAALDEIKSNSEIFLNTIKDLRSYMLEPSHPLYEYQAATFGTSKNVAIFHSYVYSELKAFTELVDSNYTYDPTYPAAADAHSIYNTAKMRFTAMDKAYKLFVEAVACAMTDHEVSPDITLADRLEAYTFAISDEGYFDNETCPGVTEALADLATLTEFEAIREFAIVFIDQVAAVSSAEYLPSKMELVAAAYQNYDAVNDAYPGVLDAKAELDSINADIENKKAAAAAYVAAVEELDMLVKLDRLETEEFVERVTAALELQKTGNIPSLPGVSSANNTLNAYKTDQEYVSAIANKFIGLVNLIDDTSTLVARFDAIKAASAAERQLVDDSVEGVIEAKNKLLTSIGIFNSDVDRVNTCYQNVVSKAADLAGSANSFSDIFGRVINLIKSIAD